MPLAPVQQRVEHPLGVAQPALFEHSHDPTANALGGATSDAITGIAIIDARPIFFITARRDWPANFDASCVSSRPVSLS